MLRPDTTSPRLHAQDHGGHKAGRPTVVIMAAAGDAAEFAPVINLGKR